MDALIFVPNGAPTEFDPPFIPSIEGYTRIHRVIEEYGGSKRYAFYIGDCFDPPIFLVSGDNFGEAYENFVCDTWVEENLAIDPLHWKDIEDDFRSAVEQGKTTLFATPEDLSTLAETEADFDLRALAAEWASNEGIVSYNDNGTAICTEAVQTLGRVLLPGEKRRPGDED